MPDEKLPWFVLERSELLTQLLLTERADLRILKRDDRGDGADFWVLLGPGEPRASRMLVVQDRGTDSTDQRDWVQSVRHLFRPNSGGLLSPVCAVVVDVRNNRLYFAWIAEPCVVSGRPSLKFHEAPAFRTFDLPALDAIVSHSRSG